MKREDVKNKIPGITDDQLDWLMQENGSDITREKSAANALQAQVDSLTAQVATAQMCIRDRERPFPAERSRSGGLPGRL